jgi:hypothetical protein
MENKISLEALQQMVSDELKRPNFSGELLSMSYEERQEIFKKANDSFPEFLLNECEKAREKEDDYFDWDTMHDPIHREVGRSRAVKAVKIRRKDKQL